VSPYQSVSGPAYPVRAYPVLAYMDRIDGVAYSSVNESGTLIRLSLRPGADPRRVAGAVRRVLREQTKDLVPVQLAGAATAAALQREQWRDKSQLTQLAASATDTEVRRTPMLLVALFLAWVAVGLGLLWWRHRIRLAGDAGEAS
jgi:hypothetical protein